MRSRVRWVRTGAVIVLSVGGIVVLLIWLAGGFHERIEPGPTQVGMHLLGRAPTVAVESLSAMREAEATLEYATIRSPLDGVIIDKAVDVGDMVKPGQTVLRLYDQLQLDALSRAA